MAIESAKSRPNGLSIIFPAVPILSAISIVLCLLILPGFWKTRIFAVVYYLCWLIAGNGLLLVNTCIWRGNVRNIPIYGDIVSIFWSGYTGALYMCILCVSKFIWTISKPAPSVRVYDERRRTNIIDACLCIGIPLLFSALSAGFLFTGRYLVAEDLGPWPTLSISLGGFIVEVIPIILVSIMSIGFSCLSCNNFWRPSLERSSGCSITRQNQHRFLSTSQCWRYTLMCLVTILGSTYGAVWITLPYVSHILEHSASYAWYKSLGFTSNRFAYRQIYIWTRGTLDSDRRIAKRNLIGFAYTLPFIGIQLFLFFGLGSEVRKTYIDWLQAIIGSKFATRISNWSKEAAWIVVRVRTRLEILAKWRTNRRQVDPSAFTPFRTEDIVLDDLSVPLHPISTLPLLPTIIPAAPSSSKRPQIVVSPRRLWREHRKESLPARLQQQGINRDSQEQQQPGRSSKARLLRMQPVYVVKNGNC